MKTQETVEAKRIGFPTVEAETPDSAVEAPFECHDRQLYGTLVAVDARKRESRMRAGLGLGRVPEEAKHPALSQFQPTCGDHRGCRKRPTNTTLPHHQTTAA